MTIFGSIKKSVKGYLDKREEEKSYQDKLDSEARAKEKEIYEEEYKKASLEAARIRAKRMALEKSGLQKLRAISQEHNIKNKVAQPGVFQKIHEYTQANIKRREENLKKTEALRNAAAQMNTQRNMTKPIYQPLKRIIPMRPLNQNIRPLRPKQPLFRY